LLQERCRDQADLDAASCVARGAAFCWGACTLRFPFSESRRNTCIAGCGAAYAWACAYDRNSAQETCRLDYIQCQAQAQRDANR
jgi:hypothetical protein